MIGTIVHTATIIVGAIAGSMIHRGIKEQYKDTLYTGLGLASLGIGLNAVITNFSEGQYPVLFIVAMAVGGVIGTAWDLDGRLSDLFYRQTFRRGRRQVR